MSEEEIAEKHVKPYLLKLGFPEELIFGYGKVPIQTGPFGVRYADYMCYIMRGEEMKPYIVVEVKKPGERLDPSQPEFYALVSNAPFFVLTNGKEWIWYFRGDSQGKSIRLESPPIPLEIAKSEIRTPSFEIGSDLKRFIASFEAELDRAEIYCKNQNLIEYRKDGCVLCPHFCLLGDTIWHDTCSDRIRETLLKADVKYMSSGDLVKLYDSILEWMMVKKHNIDVVVSEIKEEPEKVKKALLSLYDDHLSIKERFDELRKIKGFGPFMTSQLLSSVDKGRYVVIEANVLEALRSLGIIDIVPQEIHGQDYVYINEKCNSVMQKGFKKRPELGLALVHNFLWHFERAYRITGDWMRF